jgi:hypothetical protein
MPLFIAQPKLVAPHPICLPITAQWNQQPIQPARLLLSIGPSQFAKRYCGHSGRSGDVRIVRQMSTDAGRLALEMFSVGIAKAIAAMTASLQGLDLLVFIGGIGWNDAEMRNSITKRDWVGWTLLGL